jgi:RNA polymerase sigma-70 factor, ECF subfamily
VAEVPDAGESDRTDQVLLSWVVSEALTKLSEEHRAVILECYYRGRPVAEAAERLGIPPGTVKSRTHYALRALRLALEEMGVGA